MEVLHPRCAGLDVHKDTVVVCVRIHQDSTAPTQHVQTFGTTTKELLALSGFLEQHAVTVAAMEATGVYWKPVWHVLEESLDLVLANAQHIRNVPGRKTDVNDAMWIADLVAHGLIRSSFVPPTPIQDMRTLMRTRKQLVRERAQHVQRIQKTLEDANIKLTSVIYTPSQKAAILEDAAKIGPTAAAKKHNVSRFSIRDWERKVRKAVAGKGPSPTNGPSPLDIGARRDAEILEEYKTHPGLGPSQIRNQLRRRNIRVSTNTARLVMESAGYRPPKVERQKHDRRYEAVRPNHLWHLDFVQRWIGRSLTFTLILIDDCSRFVVGHGVDDAERADVVIDTFEEAVRRHGRPERVMHDKGSAFWSWRGISRFTALLEEMGIEQIVAEHKEWNGKVEAFNGNLHKELFDVHRFHDVMEMRRRLADHLAFYNLGRTHHALGGLLVPADRYFGRAEEVLARIEAGAGRELGVGHGVDLSARCLELFKVQSKNGVAEIWLLGQKLLGPPT